MKNQSHIYRDKKRTELSVWKIRLNNLCHCLAANITCASTWDVMYLRSTGGPFSKLKTISTASSTFWMYSSDFDYTRLRSAISSTRIDGSYLPTWLHKGLLTSSIKSQLASGFSSQMSPQTRRFPLGWPSYFSKEKSTRDKHRISQPKIPNPPWYKTSIAQEKNCWTKLMKAAHLKYL